MDAKIKGVDGETQSPKIKRTIESWISLIFFRLDVKLFIRMEKIIGPSFPIPTPEREEMPHKVPVFALTYPLTPFSLSLRVPSVPAMGRELRNSG
jgi:hypothetical protein